MVNNPTYLGHLVQMRTTTVSYKNHKNIKRDPSEWVVIENTHEPLVSQEIWDKCREMEASVSQGKKTKTGYVGLMFCADCGEKMRLAWNNTTNGSKKNPRKYVRHNFNCGNYNRHGKIPEDMCVSLLEKYQTEQRTLSAEVKALEEKLSAAKQDEQDVEEFIRRLKKDNDNL